LPATALPAGLAHQLVHTLGLSDHEIAALSRDEAIQLMNDYWSLPAIYLDSVGSVLVGVQPVSASLMRRAREATGLSQRSFAALARTSGPTVAAYESGAKEPRLSTLERIAHAVGLEIEIRLTPGGRGAELRERREHRSLALAAATAAAVQRDFGRAQRLTEENLVLAEKLVGATSARRWLDEWRRAIESGPEAVRCALLEEGEHGHDMRQMSPFSGVLPDEVRRAVLDAADGTVRRTRRG